MKINNILESIGNTPVVRLAKLFPNANVWMKLEKANPGGSIKDRIALAMIEDAEKKNLINKDTEIIEPTSGNTGVGLAMVAAIKNLNLTLVMPESMSLERRALMKAYGANLVLTPKELGLGGTIAKAKEMVAENKNAWMPSQFTNPANPKIHHKTTAQEVVNDFPEGLDYLITGVGTGGHITGMAEVLKEKFPGIKVLAVEPTGSSIISGGEPGPHKLQGIGPGFFPETFNKDIIDGAVKITNEEAFEEVRNIAKTEGILVGISTGASLAAVRKQLATLKGEEVILTMNYDTGERYLSVEGLLTE
ncbi:cysteine synthase A [Polaribacter sejongensis]|uniref:Cysteine synthase n=1 Tax=Polaribacter sejongensis TaxID=985043 RepID=A0AAJ1QVU3_9FLAO|nr:MULTISPECIES: cysteine synthase A [Polaribacter]AUC22637.1 cysteine synthase A [Polaribacter sejongensis]MDN3619101.1 cysteine synthase A [Polaribacter undariae]UWD33187.1 cysteine synthase A [Polaribacter undariae]